MAPTVLDSPVLEARIANAKDNVAVFHQAQGKPVMLAAAFSCMACHHDWSVAFAAWLPILGDD